MPVLYWMIRMQFGSTKVCDKALPKNMAQLITRYALSKLWVANRQLMGGQGCMRLQCAQTPGSSLKSQQAGGDAPRKSVQTHFGFHFMNASSSTLAAAGVVQASPVPFN
jgi:hypothetical protein